MRPSTRNSTRLIPLGSPTLADHGTVPKGVVLLGATSVSLGPAVSAAWAGTGQASSTAVRVNTIQPRPRLLGFAVIPPLAGTKAEEYGFSCSSAITSGMTIEELFPERRSVPLDSAYADLGLAERAEGLRRPYVVANMVSTVD